VTDSPEPMFRDSRLLSKESGLSVRSIGQLCRYGYLTHTRPSKRILLVSVADFKAHLENNAVVKTR
jgi:hypothetical protein